MFTHLTEDWRSHRRQLLAQGFWALQIHRFGAFARRRKLAVVRVPLKCAHVILSKLSEIFFGIYIGAHARIGRRFIIEHFGCICIHARAVIGDDVRVRQGVTIGNKTLDRPQDAPVIGNNVNIGAGAKILGAVIIGDNVDIGANAVVVRDVPANSIAVGVPAKIIAKIRAQPPRVADSVTSLAVRRL